MKASIKKINFSHYSARIFFIVALLAIWIIFAISSVITYQQFAKDNIKQAMYSQENMANIVSQLLNRYFFTLKYIAQNTAIQPAFKNISPNDDHKILYEALTPEYAKNIAQNQNIKVVLSEKNHAINLETNEGQKLLAKKVKNWQLFKGLPYKNNAGVILASERREIADKVLRTNNIIHYISQVSPSGDLIFLEPYEIQKNITAFNYGFRDYLKQNTIEHGTSVSEVYISNDQDKTQSISIGEPIYDDSKNIIGMLTVSSSTKMINDYLFKPLKQNLHINDETRFYLIDHHGHVVADSFANNIYFPCGTCQNDDNDRGNLRKLELFNKLKWKNDFFEKNSIWERKTETWDSAILPAKIEGEFKNLNGISVVQTFIPISLDGRNFNWGIVIETPLSQILLSTIHLKHTFYLFGSILLIILLSIFSVTFKIFKKLEARALQKEKEIIEVTRQVSHDIRSPLAALNTIVKQTKNIPENQRVMIRNAAQQINKIANNLLEQYRIEKFEMNEPHTNHPEILSLLLDTMVSEKLAQYSDSQIKIDFDINSDSHGVFCNIPAADFKRVISNIINNAVEAMNNKGNIFINLSHQENIIKLSITDNGVGMPQALILKVMSGESVTSKKSGHGIGLASAKKMIESWNGKLNITSESGKGTTIEISLPLVKPAEWFADKLTFNQNGNVIILDDDQSIHDVWESRFDTEIPDAHLMRTHYYSPEELLKADLDCNAVYLCDYELLGHALTGLDVIEKLQLKNAVLVTSRYDEPDVRARCQKNEIKILPKSYAIYVPFIIRASNQVPITDNKSKSKPDLILIDDNKTLTDAWKMSAEFSDKNIIVFNSIKEADAEIESYSFETPIYVDSDLGENIKGEDYSKLLYEKGYKNICLATGYEASKFDLNKLYWIKKIVGKDPQFD